jgi:hypothetical protein
MQHDSYCPVAAQTTPSFPDQQSSAAVRYLVSLDKWRWFGGTALDRYSIAFLPLRKIASAQFVLDSDFGKFLLHSFVQFLAFNVETLGEQFQIHPDIGYLVPNFFGEVRSIPPPLLDVIGKLPNFAAECERQKALVRV